MYVHRYLHEKMITPATCWNVENPPQIAATLRLRDSWPGSWGLQLENRFADLVPTSEHYFVLRKIFPFQFRLQAVEIRITGAKNGCFWLWCFSQPFIRCRVATAGPRFTHCTGGVLGCVSGVWGRVRWHGEGWPLLLSSGGGGGLCLSANIKQLQQSQQDVTR